MTTDTLRICHLCGHTTHERVCPRDACRTAKVFHDVSETPPRRIRRAYRITSGQIGTLGGMTLHLAESYIDGTPALVTLRCPEVLPGPADVLAQFYKESFHVRQWRSALVSNLLEFGIDDETGWLYRVFRQPSGMSIKQMVSRSGPMSVRAACRIAAEVSRMQLEAAQYGTPHVFIEPHQVYYWSDGQSEDVSLLGVGLPSARPVTTYHSTAQLLAHMLLGKDGETSSQLPPVRDDGLQIPPELVHLHALLRNVRLDKQPLDDGTIIGALEVLASDQSLPLGLLPPISTCFSESDDAPSPEPKQMETVPGALVPASGLPAIEGNTHKASTAQETDTVSVRADDDAVQWSSRFPEEHLDTPYVRPIKWLWIVGFLLACGWLYFVF